MVKGQNLQPKIESTEILLLSQWLKVKGSWSKIKEKFQLVKTLTTIADLLYLQRMPNVTPP